MNIFQTKYKYPSIKTIGIGLTNRCNLNCEHCYSRKMAGRTFTLDDVRKVLTVFPKLESVNFGTGESIFNNQFEEIVDLFHSKKIKMAITSNGLSINKMKEDTLSKFEDIDISIDFPKADLHDKWRGREGLFADATKAIKRCKKFKINVSIVAVLMANNFDYFPGFKKLLDKYDVNLRINLYKPVNKDQFTPSYSQFWTTIKAISENFEIVSCSEPILSLVWNEMSNGSKCGNSLRIHSDGEVLACVYVKNNDNYKKFNHDKKILPSFCEGCIVSKKCMGGCYGRRLIENRKSLPDSFCPFFYGKEKPSIHFKKYKQAKDLIHSSYLCTIILR